MWKAVRLGKKESVMIKKEMVRLIVNCSNCGDYIEEYDTFLPTTDDHELRVCDGCVKVIKGEVPDEDMSDKPIRKSKCGFRDMAATEQAARCRGYKI